MSETKLKPCPFCGKEDAFIEDRKEWVWCLNCLAEGPSAASTEEAKAAWNRRPLEDELIAAPEHYESTDGECREMAQWCTYPDLYQPPAQEGVSTAPDRFRNALIKAHLLPAPKRRGEDGR